MIFDKQTQFSDAQAIVASAASTNLIDLGAAGTIYGASGPMVRNVGLGAKIPLLIQIVEAFNNLTSLEVKVETDDNASFSSPTVIATTGAVALAALKLGKVLSIDAVPRDANERYIRLSYVVVGTAPTLGKVTAGIVAAVPSNG